jgi:hypothetical protein
MSVNFFQALQPRRDCKKARNHFHHPSLSSPVLTCPHLDFKLGTLKSHIKRGFVATVPTVPIFFIETFIQYKRGGGE